MSRLNTLYPNDEFFKSVSNMFGKVDSKNETEIKQEIEQIGYKEFYRYYKEKDIYIKQLKEEINKISKKELKIMQMLRSIELCTLTKERIDQIEEVMFDLGGKNE